MDPRLFRTLEKVAEARPRLALALVGRVLALASPFNAPLKAKVEVWKPHLCRLRVKNRRPLHNHVGAIHAAALVAAGESAAGLALLRTFPFSRYRLLMSRLSAEYHRQARSDIVVEVKVGDAQLEAAHSALARGESPLVALESRITEPSGALVAVVPTTWQVKPWTEVRSRK